jgi:D-serine deaminase-like pyridoxal phosphate-dependent protein
VQTPALVLDRTLLNRNLERMAHAVNKRGALFRPHLKTAKSVDIARLAAAPGIVGLTVSTLLEAEYFHSHGFSDLFYTAAIGPGKHERAKRLIKAGATLHLAVDNVDAARALSDAGRRFGVVFPTRIEIDCGDYRCGVPGDSRLLLEIAAALSGGAQISGVFTHAGQSYLERGPEAFARLAADEITAVVEASRRLRAAGFACPSLSVGSSPTAAFADEPSPDGLEVRCGVYMFWDLFQAGIGCCRHEDIALSVLTEIISIHPERNSFLIDAGALALSKDRSTEALGPDGDCFYGRVTARDGSALAPILNVTKVSQEHGTVTGREPIDFRQFSVGTRLRVLPNHACPMAAAYDDYLVVDGTSLDVATRWRRINGWDWLTTNRS